MPRCACTAVRARVRHRSCEREKFVATTDCTIALAPPSFVLPIIPSRVIQSGQSRPLAAQRTSKLRSITILTSRWVHFSNLRVTGKTSDETLFAYPDFLFGDGGGQTGPVVFQRAPLRETKMQKRVLTAVDALLSAALAIAQRPEVDAGS
jgi:hypothetical protein